MRFCLNCRTLLWAGLLVLMLGIELPAAPGAFLEPGKTAPETVLNDLGDQAVTFPASGSWNIVFYWSLFCHTCIEEMPIIAEEVAKLKDHGVRSFFVALDTKKMKKALQNFLTRRNLQLPVLLEEIASDSYRTADLWGVKVTPSAFLVGPDGRIVFSREGPFDPEDMLKLLRAALASDTACRSCASGSGTVAGK